MGKPMDDATDTVHGELHPPGVVVVWRPSWYEEGFFLRHVDTVDVVIHRLGEYLGLLHVQTFDVTIDFFEERNMVRFNFSFHFY